MEIERNLPIVQIIADAVECYMMQLLQVCRPILSLIFYLFFSQIVDYAISKLIREIEKKGCPIPPDFFVCQPSPSKVIIEEFL